MILNTVSIDIRKIMDKSREPTIDILLPVPTIWKSLKPKHKLNLQPTFCNSKLRGWNKKKRPRSISLGKLLREGLRCRLDSKKSLIFHMSVLRTTETTMSNSSIKSTTSKVFNSSPQTQAVKKKSKRI
jgi:hypothetical protein